MGEREDLLSRLRSVDEILAGARPRAPQEARLLARLRAADRARQPSSSPSSPSPLLAVGRAWRPLGVTAGLCAALALALALRAGAPTQRSVEASTSRGNTNEDGALDLEPTATHLSSTKSSPRPRAEEPRHHTTPIDERGERKPVPTAPAPELPEATTLAAPPRSAPWGSELPAPSPQLSSRDEPQPLRDGWTPARDARISSAARAPGAPALGGLDEPRVLWAEGHSEAAPKPGGSPAPRGQATSPASGARAPGCELAESLLDRARADCEAQALTLSEHGLAYLDACGEGQFRGLDYACAPASAPHAHPPPSAKAPPGCVSEELPPDGTCKTEEDTRLEALHWCEDAGLTLAGLTLDQGSCSEGFQGARLLCCEKDSEESPGKSLPRTKPACTDEGNPDCTK